MIEFVLVIIFQLALAGAVVISIWGLFDAIVFRSSGYRRLTKKYSLTFTESLNYKAIGSLILSKDETFYSRKLEGIVAGKKVLIGDPAFRRGTQTSTALWDNILPFLYKTRYFVDGVEQFPYKSGGTHTIGQIDKFLSNIK